MKVLLSGACGRMGSAVSALSERYGVTVVAGVDRIEKSVPYPLYSSFSEVKEEADAVIDFSSAEALPEVLEYCISHTVPVLLAATGYSEADAEAIEAASRKIAVFRTGNLSIGINLLETLVRRAASVLGEEFDIEIVERHHNRKKDAPSGTALMLKASAEAGRNHALEGVYGRHGMVGAREKNEIGIHAVRGGNLIGEHEVCFYGEDEIITVAHSARSRKVFASGALKAARWLIGQPAGMYDMHDLLEQIM